MREDSRVANDLVVVASSSRGGLSPLSITLHLVGAVPAEESVDMSLVRQARTFSAQVGRIAGGTSLTVLVLVWLYGVFRWRHGLEANDETLFERLLCDGPLRALLLVVGSTCLVSATGSALAIAWFRRFAIAARHPRQAAQAAVSATDSLAVACAITGGMVVLLCFGIVNLMLEVRSSYAFVTPREIIASERLFALVSILIASAAGAISAFVLARKVHRDDYELPHVAVVLAVFVFVITLAAGVKLDVGPLGTVDEDLHLVLPSHSFRTVLLVTGTSSLFVLVSAIVLRGRNALRQASRGASIRTG